MRKLLSAFALASCLAAPVVGHATNFTFNASGGAGAFTGSGVLTTTNVGSTYTITGISGNNGSAGTITGLIAPGGFNTGPANGSLLNDNLLFPGTPTLVDTHGFAFTDTMGNTSFQVDIFSTGVGAYSVYFLDSDGFNQTLPVTLTINSTVTPEPSSLLLLGTGALGLAGVARRRFSRG